MDLADILLGVLGVIFVAFGLVHVVVVFGAHRLATTFSEPDWTDFLPAAVAIGAGLAFILIGF